MKRFILLLTAAIALLFTPALFAAANPEMKPPRFIEAKRVDGHVVVFFANQFDAGVYAKLPKYEVQRKLFPYGWRDKGTATAAEVAWRDTKPAKRRAWYRMRMVDGRNYGKWTTPIIVDP